MNQIAQTFIEISSGGLKAQYAHSPRHRLGFIWRESAMRPERAKALKHEIIKLFEYLQQNKEIFNKNIITLWQRTSTTY